MEIIIIAIIIGWLFDTEEKKRERERLEKWRREHPNWQDAFGG